MELLKLNDKGEEVTCISNEEAENISGGLEIVGEPVYKLNGLEMVWKWSGLRTMDTLLKALVTKNSK